MHPLPLPSTKLTLLWLPWRWRQERRTSVIVYLPTDMAVISQMTRSYQKGCGKYKRRLPDVYKGRHVQKTVCRIFIFSCNAELTCMCIEQTLLRSAAVASQQTSYWRWNLKGIKIAYCALERTHQWICKWKSLKTCGHNKTTNMSCK
jgi:hypothetical protein